MLRTNRSHPRSSRLNRALRLLALGATIWAPAAAPGQTPAGWRSLPANLEAHGITAEAALTIDSSWNIRGGLNTGGSNVRHLLDLSFTIDTEAMLGLEGSTAFVNFQNQHGPDASADDAGDLQAFSNIDADGRTQLAQAWFQQRLADDRLRIRVGKFDANEDFAAVELGGLFIHSSPGFSPTIVAFPSYPDPAMGLSLFYEASDQAYIGFGLFDGSTQEGIRTGARGPSRAFRAPGDLFLASEGGVNWHRGPDALPGRLAVGLWHHTGTFPQFAGGRESGTEGTYLVFEQLLHAADDSAQDLEARGLGAFLQVGLADESVSPISRHLAAGLLLRGPTDGRPDDALGLMISHVRLSQEMGSGLTGDDETAWELFYRFQANSRVVVQPDLQYIRNPGGAGLDDSLVATVRVEISL